MHWPTMFQVNPFLLFRGLIIEMVAMIMMINERGISLRVFDNVKMIDSFPGRSLGCIG